MFYFASKCQVSEVFLNLTRLDNWDELGGGDKTQGSGTQGSDICGVSDDDHDDEEHSDVCENSVRGVRMSMSGKWHLAN